MLNIMALVVLLIMVGGAAYLVVFLAGLPGSIAERRNHPYTAAVRAGGWATLFLGAVLWPVVLMWAYATPEADAMGDAA